jgi:hypothetical protein
MSHIVLFPIKMLGLAAAGLALAVGWKMGSRLVEVVFDKEARERFYEWMEPELKSEEAALWKRKFSKVSGD